ncbi:hypothetical protein T11_113 [Trichinella zimbabwensis]|uniref:Uncharacterized protein n=1 Tax=Trichinella zimbabwensis TaxID=268475 RepID=A0A0V1GYA2_9BILA|nr:hypothetical protein T11_113 [Trichinella zimbabwensis]
MLYPETEAEDRPEVLVKINESNYGTEREARSAIGFWWRLTRRNQRYRSRVFAMLDYTTAEYDALKTELLATFVPILNLYQCKVMPFGLWNAPATTIYAFARSEQRMLLCK